MDRVEKKEIQVHKRISSQWSKDGHFSKWYDYFSSFGNQLKHLNPYPMAYAWYYYYRLKKMDSLNVEDYALFGVLLRI